MTTINSLPADFTTSSFGTLGRLISDSAGTRSKMDRLTAQASSGLIADNYAGLRQGAAVSLALQPALAQQTTWKANVDAAAGPMDAVQTALEQITAVATDFYARTNTLNQLSSETIDSVAGAAREALKQVAGLLDTRYGDVYVFAGKDSRTPPIPDPDAIVDGGFYSQIAAAVTGLDSTGTAGVVQATLATASSNAAGTSPFSLYLSQPQTALSDQRTSVEVGDSQAVPTGILASTNADAVSRGTSTTGSYMRDVLRALATLGSLSSSQFNSPNLASLVADTRTSLGDAISAMALDAGRLGDRQRGLAETKTRLEDTSVAIQTQLAGAEQVDMAKTLSELTQVQTQLQASYKLISAVQGMSLVQYL